MLRTSQPVTGSNWCNTDKDKVTMASVLGSQFTFRKNNFGIFNNRFGLFIIREHVNLLDRTDLEGYVK